MYETTKKIRKLFKNPRLYFFDYLNKRRNEFDPSFLSNPKTDKTNKTSAKAAVIKKKTDQEIIKKIESKLLSEEFPEVTIKEDVKNFVCIPWIKSHTNILIEQIKCKELNISELHVLPKGIERKDFLKFCRECPDKYRKYLFSRLIPLKDKIDGLIVTLDWTPPMRIAVTTCREIGIKTILIPHESVFLDEKKYYWDIKSFASRPICDIILTWGSLQKRIYTERGYPKENIIEVGSPKLDYDANYKNKLSHKEYCGIYGLREDKKIILFCAQFLDSQIDFNIAMSAQKKAILDLVEICEDSNYQLIIRTPPNGYNLLKGEDLKFIQSKDFCFYENPKFYLTGPSEAIFHADLVVSMNSTMLFEATIMNTPSLSVRYIDIKSIWRQSIIPVARNKEELKNKVNEILTNGFIPDKDEYSRLKKEFGVGEFDGNSKNRIKKILINEVANYSFPNLYNRLIKQDILDVCCIPSSEEILQSSQKYVKNLLNCRTLLNKDSLNKKEMIASVEVFFQWGSLLTGIKEKQQKIAKETGKPIVYLEDGFIRSIKIGLSKSPGLSIIWDDLSPYYNANIETRLEQILNSDFFIKDDQKEKAKNTIDFIVKNNISKYNHSPIVDLEIGRKGHKKILLVDQRFGDMSVEMGMGSERTFDDMLREALEKGKEYDIIIKQHPDSITGGKKSYFNNEKIAFTKDLPNVFIIDYDINPYSLMKNMEEVFVCTSGLGFEALLAGKKVTCFGVPFYSGWGVTEDKIRSPRRLKSRSIEEIFYVAYILLSRYFNPETNKICDIKEVCEYIIRNR